MMMKRKGIWPGFQGLRSCNYVKDDYEFKKTKDHSYLLEVMPFLIKI
jgi:hypothetical protein